VSDAKRYLSVTPPLLLRIITVTMSKRLSKKHVLLHVNVLPPGATHLEQRKAQTMSIDTKSAWW
jgi:hypothetical protein